LLVDTRFLGAVGEVDKVGIFVISPGLCDLGCCNLTCPACFLALGRVWIEADGRDDCSQCCIDGVVEAGSLEDPEDGIVGGVRHGELLELETLVL
jgi:hypothetical protein